MSRPTFRVLIFAAAYELVTIYSRRLLLPEAEDLDVYMTPQVADSPARLDADSRLGRATIALLRIGLGLLWIQNVFWKIPPDFGEAKKGDLYGWVNEAVKHPVFPPYSWLVENLVLPNFVFFGWVVLLTEMAIGAFLLVGILTRFWALVGIAQTVAITLSVLFAPNEWHWAYYMMLMGHAVLFGVAAGRAYGMDAVLHPRLQASRSRIAQIAARLS